MVKSKQQLVEDFTKHVAGQSHEFELNNIGKSNKHVRAYMKAFQALCEVYGDEGRDELASLLTDERQNVRQMAAVFLLRHRHVEAKKVLEDLAKGVGITAFGAQEAMKRWEEGAWRLDP